MSIFSEARQSAFESVGRRQAYRTLNAAERHAKFMHDYVLFYGGESAMQSEDPSKLLRDTDITALQRAHRFVRTEQDDAEAGDSFEGRIAKRYYQRLFKEYCIADLSRYKESKLGMRWRTEKEVVVGKGQFICGAKGCEEKSGLCSYEVNFAYVEARQQKQALVKLRVCPACAYQLNYKREKAFEKSGQQGSSKRKAAPSDNEVAGSKERAAKRSALKDAEEFLRRVAAGESVSEPSEPQSSAPYDPSGSVAPPPERRSVGRPPEAVSVSVLPGDDSLWEQKRPTQESATTEEDFDQYFEGLFL